MSVKSKNLVAVTHRVSPEERWKAHGHRGGVLWFTGLPGSGKSTLALELEQRLFKSGRQVYVLDGDNVRHGLSSDLGFSPEDRTENIRRIGEVAALFANAGMIVLTAFISPYRADRDLARKACGDTFHEVYVSAPLEVCEERDPKGHYKMAREGKIPEFTGISAPYEAPLKPEFTVDTGAQSLDESAEAMVAYIDQTFSV